MKQRYEIISNGPEETAKIASSLADRLKKGDVITLEGDLGAGKTTFTKALAKGLGINRTVNSPTFTIIKEYTEAVYLFTTWMYIEWMIVKRIWGLMSILKQTVLR